MLHHYIVTHAKDGVTPAVDANMYWRTKAKEDGAGEALLHANYAGKTQATKGSEARFPDGEYTLHFLASDLVHSNVDLQFKNVRLENYTPFIKEMTIYLDRDNSIGTQANADYPGCELKIYEFKHNNPDSYPGANFAAAKTGEFIGADQKICIKIRFSEGMDSAWADFKVSLDPGGVGAGASPIAFAGSFSKTYTEDDTWKGSATMPADASGGSDSSNSVITVKARDLPDRSSNQRGLDKNDDGVGEPDFTDDIHKVPTDARPPEPSLMKTP